ncbi:MAG: FAD-dependent oxidoreductase [Planctomycetota bacterium]
MTRVAALLLICSMSVPASGAEKAYDVVVYGGTSAGVIAAVEAAREGRRVVMVCPDEHLGGLTAGGLGWTDTGRKEVIGGLAREFYHRVWKHYQSDEAWRWQTRDEYGNKGQGTSAADGEKRTMWIFEPHVAENIFDAMTIEEQIPVFRDARLDRENGVQKQDGRIVAITTLADKTYRGRVFIDATYEGDLMAAAGVSYHVGRESAATYDERWNGVQKDARHHAHFFPEGISPYRVPEDPASGLLPRISDKPPGENGQSDHRVQAYCFRMCLTQVPENRLPFPKPTDYDPAQYELLLRVFETGWRQTFRKFDPIPNAKTDTNNHGPFSTDNIGYNYGYPEASYAGRREIVAEHERYQKGLMYFLANDPRVPEDVREPMSRWGLAKDEFTDNGNWPHQIYVREARRMKGAYMMTEHDCLCRVETPKSVGMGSYAMDSHNVQRYVTAEGFVQNEGDIGVRPPYPYMISYDSLTPKKNQCTNLLVPVCVSSSHIAFGSIRMEPVFMILGQSAAVAAGMAIDTNRAVQDVNYLRLKDKLLEKDQVLEWQGPKSSSSRSVPARSLSGIIIDNDKAKLSGNWLPSSAKGKFVGRSYLHDDHEAQGKKSAVFTVKVPDDGTHAVRLAYAASSNRATNVPVIVRHADGTTKVTVNQREKPPIDDLFIELGEFRFDADQPAAVEIRNDDANGYVIVDAVQCLPRK